jgi:fermentation-respiration switch protein FrsA (DUF1100 family)
MASSQAAAISPRRRTRWGRLLLFAVALYLGACVVLRLLENAFIYHPHGPSDWVTPPASLHAEDVWLRSSDGTRIHAWWCPAPDAKGALLYCHGNAGNLSYRHESVAELRQALGTSVLIFDYPGFGRSDGKPNEAGCYLAGEAAYDWLAQRVPPEHIVLFGKSLGGAIATDLAVRKPHAALVLVKTFTSIPDMGQQLFPWLPVRWLVGHEYDTRGKIGRCPRPIFIAHGDCDRIIPLSHGQQLFAAAPEPKQFFLMKGCDHNDPFPPDFLATLAGFLNTVAPIPAK